MTTPPTPWDALPCAERWWSGERVSSILTRLWEPHVDPLLRCSAWHIRGADRDLLIDSGLGITSLRASFPKLFERDLIAVATHSHNDHTGGMHEFDGVWVHPTESAFLANPLQGRGTGLLATDFDPDERAYLVSAGYEVPDLLLSALPTQAYDPSAYRVRPASVCGHLTEGDVVDLGDRKYRVLHVPGHTPGSIALLNEDGSELFTGDALYDGPLLAGLEESDTDQYVDSILRIRALSVSRVHPGHERSFDGIRKDQLCDRFLAMHSPQNLLN